MTVLLKRAYVYPAHTDPAGAVVKETTEWRMVGEFEDRNAAKGLLEEDVAEAQFAVYEAVGGKEGLPKKYELSQVVKVTAQDAEPSLRKI